MGSNSHYKEYSEFLEFLRTQTESLVYSVAESAMKKAVAYLLGKIPPYPKITPSDKLSLPDGSSFLHTDRQRRWFFAALADGKIRGWRVGAGGKPKKFSTARTGELGRSFTTSTNQNAGIIEGEIGTKTSYAPWVVGDDHPGTSINGKNMYQARVHVDRWWQFGVEMKKEEKNAYEVFQKEFMNIFEKEKWE